MNIILSGICGHMGQELKALCENGYKGARLLFGIDKNPADSSYTVFSSFEEVDLKRAKEADCIVDFSHHLSTKELIDFAVKASLPLVIATTGHTEEEKKMIDEASKKIPLFFAANLSMGIALLAQSAKFVVSAMPEAEIEIVETHHSRKLDAPSGTALMLANEIKSVRPGAYNKEGRSGHAKREFDEIGIHAIRRGNVVGEHEIIVSTPTQTITLRHEAHSRALFAEGALTAAAFVLGKEAGLYSMKDMVSF